MLNYFSDISKKAHYRHSNGHEISVEKASDIQLIQGVLTDPVDIVVAVEVTDLSSSSPTSSSSMKSSPSLK